MTHTIQLPGIAQSHNIDCTDSGRCKMRFRNAALALDYIPHGCTKIHAITCFQPKIRSHLRFLCVLISCISA